MYAIAWENDECGCVETYCEKFGDAVYEASKFFGGFLSFFSPEQLVEFHDSETEFVRVDVFECDDEEDADRQFADGLFVPLFHLDSGMEFWG